MAYITPVIRLANVPLALSFALFVRLLDLFILIDLVCKKKCPAKWVNKSSIKSKITTMRGNEYVCSLRVRSPLLDLFTAKVQKLLELASVFPMNFENNFVYKIKSLYFNYLRTEDYIHFCFCFMLFDSVRLLFALVCPCLLLLACGCCVACYSYYIMV